VQLTTKRVAEALGRCEPEPLTLPVRSLDHADHVLKTALMGHPELAADHLLHPEAVRDLPAIVSSIARRATLFIEKERLRDCGECELEDRIVRRARIYKMVLELTLNLVGVERAWARIDEDCADLALRSLLSALEEWEEGERGELGEPAVLAGVIRRELERARRVNRGKSMVAAMAAEIEKGLKGDSLARSFVEAAKKVLAENFYRRAYEAGICKFGNDYALGLRWLRHLGFVQVSTNPVLAARAYDDDPELWEAFKKYASKVLSSEHPEWFTEPEKYVDDLAMEATRFALLENFYVFRVPFVLSGYHDGLVSYQLNPLIAHDAEKSVEAVRVFVERLERDLAVYDEYLWWGYSVPEKGRPNLVVKVAAAYPAAIEIAERINSMGVGQNITLSYTVSQEVLAGAAALRGMAKAAKKGIVPTQTYDTNMGGRLEDHLREVLAAKLLLETLGKLGEGERWRLLDRLASRLGAKPEEWGEAKRKGLEAAVEYLCSVRVLGRSLLRPEYVEALTEAGALGSRADVEKMLERWERAIALSGTYVAKRVYEIFFAPWNRGKWVEYLVRTVGVTREQAELVLDRFDLLPASKRKPIDTLLALSSLNVTNTEFPDHQLNVVEDARELSLEELRESVAKPLGGNELELLMQLEDFVKAYEASPETVELLREAEIEQDYGHRGVSPNDWPSYGPCSKTLREFTNAYLAFRSRVYELAKEVGRDFQNR
jgi:hypothetical protein